MDEVFPVGVVFPLVSRSVFAKAAFVKPSYFKIGVVERLLKPGQFIVLLDSGSKIEVRGSDTLKVGNPVRVSFGQFGNEKSEKTLLSPKSNEEPVANNPSHWTALFPLGFGGREANARLEVYVDRRRQETIQKNPKITYLIFTISTELQGEVQWIVHLVDNHVSIQVYRRAASDPDFESFKDLVKSMEVSLRSKGLVLTGPTVFLKKPMVAPTGFQLSFRG